MAALGPTLSLERSRARAGEIAELERAAAPYPWTEEQWRQSIVSERVWTLAEAGKILGVGVFSLVADEASVLNLFVCPSQRGRGLASQLLQQGLDDCCNVGASHCFLEVRVSNRSALSLYQRSGFVKCGRRVAYYRDGDSREDALLMRCDLPTAMAINQP